MLRIIWGPRAVPLPLLLMQGEGSNFNPFQRNFLCYKYKTSLFDVKRLVFFEIQTNVRKSIDKLRKLWYNTVKQKGSALSPLGRQSFCEDNLRDKKRSDFYEQIFFGRGRKLFLRWFLWKNRKNAACARLLRPLRLCDIFRKRRTHRERERRPYSRSVLGRIFTRTYVWFCPNGKRCRVLNFILS